MDMPHFLTIIKVCRMSAVPSFPLLLQVRRDPLPGCGRVYFLSPRIPSPLHLQQSANTSKHINLLSSSSDTQTASFFFNSILFIYLFNFNEYNALYNIVITKSKQHRHYQWTKSLKIHVMSRYLKAEVTHFQLS